MASQRAHLCSTAISLPTGNLDTETLKMMSIPRCGVKDKVGVASDNRSKRYALQGKLSKTTISRAAATCPQAVQAEQGKGSLGCG